MTKSKFFAPMLPSWTRMVADGHPWVSVIKGNAEMARYADHGRWAALAYAITDSTSYAQKAWNGWKGTRTAPKVLAPGDEIRESFVEYALLYDLLRDYLESIGELANVEAVLRSIAEIVLVGSPTNIYMKGTRPIDSDQVVGSFFGLAMTDAVLGSDYLHRTWGTPDWKVASMPTGGLTSTGADTTSTIRNLIALYCKMAEGGNWIESGFYDLNTTQLIYRAWRFLHNFHGVDYFPEVARFVDQHRHQLLHHFHPSLKDSFQYGDEQHPNYVRAIEYDGLLGCLSYLPGDADLTAAVRGLEASLRATNNWPFKAGALPGYARYFYFADPYQDGVNDRWRGFAGRTHYSPGQGHVYERRADAALHFTFLTMKELTVDHAAACPFGSLQIVKGNDRAIYHPIAYGPEPRAYNQATIMNRPGSYESSEIVAFDEGGDYLYTAGVSAGCGPDITAGYYDPPAPYLHELARCVIRLGDVLIVHDRLHAENPFERYYPTVKARMEKRRGLKTVYWHAPEAPKISGHRLSWTVGATVVRIEAITPLDMQVEIVDTNTPEFALAGNYQAGQKKWVVCCTPPDRLFDSIVWGIDLGGDATFEPFQQDSLTGVWVKRPNQSDALVLFSALPGPTMVNTFDAKTKQLVHDRTKAQQVFKARLLQDVALTVPTGTRVYLADLAAGATVRVNEQMFTASTPDRLLAVEAVVDIPPPPPASAWRVTSTSDKRIVLECD
jgi:hypothetical protein